MTLGGVKLTLVQISLRSNWQKWNFKPQWVFHVNSIYNLINNWLPFKTLHAVFFGVFLARIFPHSDWIQTRKSLNTETFHAVIFSDNTNVFYTNSHIKTLFNEMNIALKNISECLKTNKLSVNEKIKLNFYFYTSFWYL